MRILVCSVDGLLVKTAPVTPSACMSRVPGDTKGAFDAIDRISAQLDPEQTPVPEATE